MELSFLSSPRPIFSFRNLSLSCCLRSITIVCPHIRFSSASYVEFSAVAPAFTFLFVSFTSRMGRRRTPEENGWDPEAHEEEDSQQRTKDEPTSRYVQNLQETLHR